MGVMGWVFISVIYFVVGFWVGLPLLRGVGLVVWCLGFDCVFCFVFCWFRVVCSIRHLLVVITCVCF